MQSIFYVWFLTFFLLISRDPLFFHHFWSNAIAIDISWNPENGITNVQTQNKVYRIQIYFHFFGNFNCVRWKKIENITFRTNLVHTVRTKDGSV